MKILKHQRPSFLYIPLNSKGVSLVEALLALGLVAMIALSSISFFSDVSQVSHRSRESCRMYNMAFLDRIRSYGMISSISNFSPLPTSNVVTSGSSVFPAPQPLPAEVLNSARWPNQPILSAGSEPLINNALLIEGYMTILQSLYNSYPGICSNFTKLQNTTSIPANSIMPLFPEDMKDPTADNSGVKIRIIPFNIDTGATLNCSAAAPPLRVAPRGTFLSSNSANAPYFGTDYGGQRKLSIPPDVRLDIGFAVQIQTEFANDQGERDVCLSEGRFQYDIDTTAPPEPQVLDLTLASMPAVCTPHSTNNYTLNVGYDLSIPGSRIEPGTVLLCQDLSVIPTTAQTTGGYPTQAGIQCYTGNNASAPAPPGPQVSSDFQANGYYPPPGNTGFNYTGLGTVIPPKWVRCTELTLCGVAPMAGGVTNTSTEGPPTRLSYQIRYQNLPSDCRVIVRVAGVDTAANPSLEVNSPSYADFTSNKPVFTSWDVPRPRCQNFCSVGPWPNGYFTCGSC